mmetsp:Transcript_8284/g.18556  ORF Transcript_8284/g.18556 Transcript_8284/m.18556 type:complete len:473 (+) Transcript_8284:234-1652(+)
MFMTAIVHLLMFTYIASTLAYNVQQQSRSRFFSPLQLHRTSSMAMSLQQQPDTLYPYQPPAWAENVLKNVPKHGRLHLANLPTPVHLIGSKAGSSKNGILSRLAELNIKLYIKRDDATGGAELGGNKVRKLEFLLADALAKGCDSVVTIGGEQSNHCRATAAASRMVGLSPHLILRTRRADAIHEKKDDIGWTGNILFDRMVGSTIYTCTPGEYGRLGSNKLVDSVCEYIQLKKKSHNNPYPIPVGGSNAIGTWGYINGVDELMQQIETTHDDDSLSEFALDHVIFATGSGGTATGIALGLSLAYGSLGDGHPATVDQSAPKVHAVGVCDNPEYFYQTMSSIADEMGICLPSDKTTEQFVREAVTVHHGKGRGYALNSDEELDFIMQFSIETGIALDPVYSGKALYCFLKKVVEGDPESYRNKNILFWHTGGGLGLYEKGDDLLERLSRASPVKRIDAYAKKGASGDDVVAV